MTCIPDPSNLYDRFAVIVQAPSAEDVQHDLLHIETRAPPRQQLVSDVVGSIVGHVPKNICNVISCGLSIHRTLSHAVCFFTGDIVLDNGPQLCCVYLLEFAPSSGNKCIEAANHLHHFLPDDDIFL